MRMEKLKKYFLLFVMYSMMGWIMEVLLALICLRKFVNRGVLIGPYLPIYGVGCLLILLLVQRYKNKPWLLVICSMLICSALEYVTSFLLEAIFNTRWWDYSNNFMNLNGRICIETTALFGVLGAFIVYVVNPVFMKLIYKMPNSMINILFYFFASMMIIDAATSFTSVSLIRNSFGGEVKDTTEEVSKNVLKFISGSSLLIASFNAI